MTTAQSSKEEPRAGAQAGGKVQAVELRVLVPEPVMRTMDINRTLVGQTRQAFVVAALQRHLELYSHLMLDISPQGRQGVGIHVGDPAEPRRTMADAIGPPPADPDEDPAPGGSGSAG